MAKINRRDLLKVAGATPFGLSIRSMLTGLPCSFLLGQSPVAMAQQGDAKFMLLSVAGSGESINCNGMGSYPVNASDVAGMITHPNTQFLGTQVLGQINGLDQTAADLENPVELIIGNRPTLVPRAYQLLPQAFLNNLCAFNYRSLNNAHTAHRAVRTLFGGLKGPDGQSEEDIVSALAQELQPLLGTTTALPFSTGSAPVFAAGVGLTDYSPLLIKALFLGELTDADFQTIYTQTIDYANRALKDPALSQTERNIRKRFLDNYAQTNTNAISLGNQLGNLLSDINDESVISRIKLGLALFKIRYTPVVSFLMTFSGDNHADANLLEEGTATVSAIETLRLYWEQLQALDLTDQVNFAHLDAFGRGTRLSLKGGVPQGRNHLPLCTQSLMHGTNLRGGVIGGYSPDTVTLDGDQQVISAGINSVTGTTDNPDIPADETLNAFMKTLMATAGVSEERRNIRIPNGKVVAIT